MIPPVKTPLNTVLLCSLFLFSSYSSGRERGALLFTGAATPEGLAGIERVLERAAIPYGKSDDLTEALEASMVFLQGDQEESLFHEGLWRRCVAGGGTLVVFHPDRGFLSLVGASSFRLSSSRRRLTWVGRGEEDVEPLDAPFLRIVPLQERETLGYLPGEGRGLALFEDGTGAVVERALGRGWAYGLNLPFGEIEESLSLWLGSLYGRSVPFAVRHVPAPKGEGSAFDQGGPIPVKTSLSGRNLTVLCHPTSLPLRVKDGQSLESVTLFGENREPIPFVTVVLAGGDTEIRRIFQREPAPSRLSPSLLEREEPSVGERREDDSLRGVYIWSKTFEDYSRKTLLDRAAHFGCREIFLSYPKSMDPAAAFLFLRDAHARGFIVHGVVTDTSWLDPSKRSAVTERIQEIVALPFDGLHVDIEPHTMDEWEDQQDLLTERFIDLLAHFRSSVPGNWQLSVALMPTFPETALARIYSLVDRVGAMIYGIESPERIIVKLNPFLKRGEEKTQLLLRPFDFDSPTELSRCINRVLRVTGIWKVAFHDLERWISWEKEYATEK